MATPADARGGGARRELVAYFTAASAWATANGIQNVLFTWTFVGVLGASADMLGNARVAVALPGLAFMLLGGATADQADGRSLLLKLHVLATLPPIFLGAVTWFGLLDVWTLIAYSLGIRILVGFAAPARDAMLSQLARRDLQRSITIMAALQSASSIVGIWIAGQVDWLGVEGATAIQAVVVLSGVAFIARLSPAVIEREQRSVAPWRLIGGGLKETWRIPPVRHAIGVTFVAGLVSNGAFGIAFPLLIRDVYGGDASVYAYMMMLFRVGSIAGSLILLRFMPIVRPGRVMLLALVLRSAAILMLAFLPPFWAFVATTFIWGSSMGFSGSLGRSIVQESASEDHRARIMSVQRLSMMGAAPLGAFAVGYLVVTLGLAETLMIVPFLALACAVYGMLRTELWRFQSRAHLVEERPRVMLEGGD